MSIHVRSTAKGRRYDVKVRSADGTQHSKTFATRREATEYQSRQVAALADGIFIAPRAGATTVADLAVRWLASGTKRDSTRVRDRSIVMNHVLPGLGPTRAVGKLTRADCQALVDLWQSQGQAPRTVSRQRATLRAMLQHAVDADLIARNPAVGLKVPSSDEVDRPTLTSEQLEALATELGADQGTFMWCGAVLGLRWAETAGLTVPSLDSRSGTVRVSAQIDRRGQLSPPKTRGSLRTLAAPEWLIEDLAAVVGRQQSKRVPNSDALVFVNQAGRPLAYTNWRQRVWQPATAAAGLPGIRYHDLRSVAASALLASGVDLRTAMHRLGHTTPAMTLGVYARVANDRDRAAADAVAARLAPRRVEGASSA